ncbi:MAG: hypothetical protein JWP31_2515 [Aeromicrobium sp.]|nr:hypothetical protein [Aeromicrobium sp.]
MEIHRKAAGRLAATLLAAVALVVGSAPGVQAEESSLERAAAAVLSTALPGQPLKVVTTTRTSNGPAITATVATSSAQALDLIKAGLRAPSTIGVDLARPVSIATTNDPYRRQQWALDRLEAETVWRKASGRGVTVAVIDTGVRRDHPDLYGAVLSGYDFVNPGTPATDQNGHGTHVAGVVAARADNGRGIAGLARRARILPVRVLGADGSGDTAAVAKGIVWAVNHGAQVINLSLASAFSDSASKAAVAYAISRRVVVVAAAGNSGCGLFGSPRTYPAAYDGVIGVAAITRAGAVASYSNCGSYVDVAAPGSEIVSTTISRPDRGLGCPTGLRYCTLSGTSMAAPHVAAAAAILISRVGRLSPSTVTSIIESTADDVGASGVDRRAGHGVINPRRMLAGR